MRESSKAKEASSNSKKKRKFFKLPIRASYGTNTTSTHKIRVQRKLPPAPLPFTPSPNRNSNAPHGSFFYLKLSIQQITNKTLENYLPTEKRHDVRC
mmetsp:Transcript_32372/g.126939  ORF Transcript_32372/g.126939 Transcript_32372/m.126939 type:complete len:97 (-) Transcript_32372:48-338(-)